MATPMATFDRNRALALLRAGVGDPGAAFRADQAEAIEHVVTGAGRLVLVSSYDPSARFNVGHAMQRNKAIYALAEAALIVDATVGHQ